MYILRNTPKYICSNLLSLNILFVYLFYVLYIQDSKIFLVQRGCEWRMFKELCWDAKSVSSWEWRQLILDGISRREVLFILVGGMWVCVCVEVTKPRGFGLGKTQASSSPDDEAGRMPTHVVKSDVWRVGWEWKGSWLLISAWRR